MQGFWLSKRVLFLLEKIVTSINASVLLRFAGDIQVQAGTSTSESNDDDWIFPDSAK